MHGDTNCADVREDGEQESKAEEENGESLTGAPVNTPVTEVEEKVEETNKEPKQKRKFGEGFKKFGRVLQKIFTDEEEDE